jgi:hypothetical protein
MKEQEPYNAFTEKEQKEPVQISKTLLEKVREQKKKTGVTITAFIEQAVKEKLNLTPKG